MNIDDDYLVLGQRLTEALYQPPFANPEFLAIHGERMKGQAKERAAKQACELMEIIKPYLRSRT